MEKKAVKKSVVEGRELDLVGVEGLELFAEEIPAQHQRHTAGGDTLSTLGCDCGLSTFGCLSGSFAS
jgi:hypothetical protein